MSSQYPNDVNSISVPLLHNPLLQESPSEDDDLDLGQIGYVLRRRALPMALVGLVVSGLVGWRLMKLPAIYQESFQLLIQPPNSDTMANPLLSSGGGWGGTFGQDVSYYETQMKLLTSNVLLLPVVEAIKKQKEFFESEEERNYFNLEQFERRLRVSKTKDTQIVEVSYQSQSPKEVKFVLDKLAAAYLKYTIEAQTFQSEQKLYFLDKQIPIIKQRILSLQNRLREFRLRNRFMDPTTQGEIIGQGIQDITRAKQQNEAQLQNAIALYQNLRQQLGINEPQALSLNALTESPRYMALLTKLRDLDTKLASESTRFTEDSSIIQQLQEERKNLLPLIQQEAKIALNGLATEKSLGVSDFVAPNSIRQNLTMQLMAAASQVKQLQASQQSLEINSQKLQEQIQRFAGSASQYAELAGEIDIEEKGLASLLVARQALEIEAAKSFSPWRLVSKISTPERPQSQLLRNLLVSLLAGVVAGGATGLLLEALDRNFHTSEELAEYSGLTVLGSIPTLKSLNRVKKLTNQSQLQKLLSTTPAGWISFMESFSFLYTNLFFVGEKKICNTIVITSATPGEGKSTIAFFLSLAAANLGRKVLLVDGDRYFPQTEYWVNLASLSQIEKNQNPKNEKFEPQSIQQEGMQNQMISNNFYIIQDTNFHPSQMIEQNAWFETMEGWKREFDIVIIDSPPVLGLSDTKLIANHCDGVLLVCRMDRVSRDLVKETLLELKIANLKVIGAIANATSSINRRDYYYYNYYYSKAKKMIDAQR